MRPHPYRAALAAIALGLAVACSQPAAELEAKAGLAQAQATLDLAMQADRDFAGAVRQDGAKAAFLAWFEPEGSQFIGPGGVRSGAAAIAEPFGQSPPGFTMDWAPDGGIGAAGGDVAVTTGRYAMTTGGVQIEAGRYVTTWRKPAQGNWHVVLHTRVADPAAPLTSEPDPEGRPG